MRKTAAAKPRTCVVPGCTTRTTHARCGKHQHRASTTKRKAQQAGSTTARGYGTAHAKARAEYVAKLRDGDACAECQRLGKYHPMYRTAIRNLDLSHNETRTGYIGLSWARCNRREGAVRGNAMRTTPVRYSNIW